MISFSHLAFIFFAFFPVQPLFVSFQLGSPALQPQRELNHFGPLQAMQLLTFVNDRLGGRVLSPSACWMLRPGSRCWMCCCSSSLSCATGGCSCSGSLGSGTSLPPATTQDTTATLPAPFPSRNFGQEGNVPTAQLKHPQIVLSCNPLQSHCTSAPLQSYSGSNQTIDGPFFQKGVRCQRLKVGFFLINDCNIIQC